eukprot:scaffold16761_cov60-Attheya_sp.AAC.2
MPELVSAQPSAIPSSIPSAMPSREPSVSPSTLPSSFPSYNPSTAISAIRAMHTAVEDGSCDISSMNATDCITKQGFSATNKENPAFPQERQCCSVELLSITQLEECAKFPSGSDPGVANAMCTADTTIPSVTFINYQDPMTGQISNYCCDWDI